MQIKKSHLLSGFQFFKGIYSCSKDCGYDSHAVSVYALNESKETRGYSSVRETGLMCFKNITLTVYENQSKLIAGRAQCCPTVKDAEKDKGR